MLSQPILFCTISIGLDCVVPTLSFPYANASSTMVTVPAPIMTPGPLLVCYSTDGGASYVVQRDAVGGAVLGTSTTSITDMAPLTIGAGANNVQLTLVGQPPTEGALLAFALVDDCSTTRFGSFAVGGWVADVGKFLF